MYIIYKGCNDSWMEIYEMSPDLKFERLVHKQYEVNLYNLNWTDFNDCTVREIADGLKDNEYTMNVITEVVIFGGLVQINHMKNHLQNVDFANHVKRY